MLNLFGKSFLKLMSVTLFTFNIPEVKMIISINLYCSIQATLLQLTCNN